MHHTTHTDIQVGAQVRLECARAGGWIVSRFSGEEDINTLLDRFLGDGDT